jgi:hypothetical protein
MAEIDKDSTSTARMSQEENLEVPQSPDLPDPVTYMRGLHPDLYSDSATVTSVELTSLAAPARHSVTVCSTAKSRHRDPAE